MSYWPRSTHIGKSRRPRPLPSGALENIIHSTQTSKKFPWQFIYTIYIYWLHARFLTVFKLLKKGLKHSSIYNVTERKLQNNACLFLLVYVYIWCISYRKYFKDCLSKEKTVRSIFPDCWLIKLYFSEVKIIKKIAAIASKLRLGTFISNLSASKYNISTVLPSV